MLKKKCGLIPQVFFGNFGKAAEKGDDRVRNFVAVEPEEITRGAGSVEITISGGVGSENDVIDAVERQIHYDDLLHLIPYYSIEHRIMSS